MDDYIKQELSSEGSPRLFLTYFLLLYTTHQHIPYHVVIVDCNHVGPATVSFKDVVHRGTLPTKQQMFW